MKNLRAIILSVMPSLMVFAAPTAPTALDPGGWQNIKWGASEAEVIKATEGKAISTTGLGWGIAGATLGIEDWKVEDHFYHVSFIFREGKLGKVTIHPRTVKNPRGILVPESDSSELQIHIIEQYGKPASTSNDKFLTTWTWNFETTIVKVHRIRIPNSLLPIDEHFVHYEQKGFTPAKDNAQNGEPKKDVKIEGWELFKHTNPVDNVKTVTLASHSPLSTTELLIRCQGGRLDLYFSHPQGLAFERNDSALVRWRYDDAPKFFAVYAARSTNHKSAFISSLWKTQLPLMLSSQKVTVELTTILHGIETATIPLVGLSEQMDSLKEAGCNLTLKSKK